MKIEKNKLQHYEKYSHANVWMTTIFWVAGLILLFVIWWIFSATLHGPKFTFPTIGDTFVGIGMILSGQTLTYVQTIGGAVPQAAAFMIGQEWTAIFISIGQAAMCFVCAFVIVALLVYLAHIWKPLKYIFAPFVTYTRTLPTAVLMCMISLLFAPGDANVWLIPIIVAFCILFPVLYNSVQNAFDQVNIKKIEVGYIYGMGKWNIFTKIILKQMTPYIFNSMVTGFGLTFKVVLASQLVSIAITNITPNYASVGWMIGLQINALNIIGATSTQLGTISGIILGWGMIAIFISLLFELGFKGAGWLCMPWTHKKYHSPEIVNKEKNQKSKGVR
ncbi:MAG: ABC transporter permease subunit [Malacoplasma sp.]|nr:ABC transporter permease subunit [Malacoplasma sp.]